MDCEDTVDWLTSSRTTASNTFWKKVYKLKLQSKNNNNSVKLLLWCFCAQNMEFQMKILIILNTAKKMTKKWFKPQNHLWSPGTSHWGLPSRYTVVAMLKPSSAETQKKKKTLTLNGSVSVSQRDDSLLLFPAGNNTSFKHKWLSNHNTQVNTEALSPRPGAILKQRRGERHGSTMECKQVLYFT